MRTCLTVGILALSLVAVVGWFKSLAAVPVPAPPVKDEKKAISDDRDDLSAKLLQRVTLDKPLENMPLKEVIEFLADKYELAILVDGKSFGNFAAVHVALNADDEVLNKQINVPMMKNVRLSTVLKHVTDQIDGGFLLYPDHIKIVSTQRIITLTKLQIKDYAPDDDAGQPQESDNEIARQVPLVQANFKEAALTEALREIEVRTNRTIVLAPQAGDRAKTPVTCRFANVPVETAVATLAELAGLKVARKGNVLLVTVAERVKEFAPPPVNPFPNGYGPGLPFVQPDPQIEELKKKISELEKTIMELKKK